MPDISGLVTNRVRRPARFSSCLTAFVTTASVTVSQKPGMARCVFRFRANVVVVDMYPDGSSVVDAVEFGVRAELENLRATDNLTRTQFGRPEPAGVFAFEWRF
jgi:hypothetical protein